MELRVRAGARVALGVTLPRSVLRVTVCVPGRAPIEWTPGAEGGAATRSFPLGS